MGGTQFTAVSVKAETERLGLQRRVQCGLRADAVRRLPEEGPSDAPDANFGGYNFWQQKLNQFNGDYISAEMVKAFIESSEYRQRFGQP